MTVTDAIQEAPMLESPPVPDLSPPTPAAPLPDLPRTRPGSRWDAKLLRQRIQSALQAADRVDEQVRLLCEQARSRRIYLVLEDPQGNYFQDWTSFVTAPIPWGLGMNPALIDELVKERRDPKRQARLVLEGPPLLQTRSAPRKGRTQPGVRGLEYTLARLRRDRVDLLERVAAGELTIQAAAELAGHKPPIAGVLVEPAAIARLIVSRLDEPQQREVIRLVQHPQEIPDPLHGTNAHWEAFLERTLGAEAVARKRTEAAAAKAAHKEAYKAAYRGRRQELNAARSAQAAALGLPSLAVAAAP
jgi:hypothetical protein